MEENIFKMEVPTIENMVSFLKDQAGDTLTESYYQGYEDGLHKMHSIFMDLIEIIKLDKKYGTNKQRT